MEMKIAFNAVCTSKTSEAAASIYRSWSLQAFSILPFCLVAQCTVDSRAAATKSYMAGFPLCL